MTSTYHIGLLFLRVFFSGLMLVHGLPKLMNLVQGNLKFADPIGIGAVPSLLLAVIGEVVCPLLIIIGFKTRLAAIPAAITMAVAAFIIHGGDAFSSKEKALLYLIAFITIACTGPGKYAVDRG
jgi:putative oxidoreductase